MSADEPPHNSTQWEKGGTFQKAQLILMGMTAEELNVFLQQTPHRQHGPSPAQNSLI